jgi:uncharacterized NAD(P)/FAD-binding protein YdhS
MNLPLNPLQRVAVVGAGLSGTSFLSELVRSLRRNGNRDVEIHVFEKSDEFGPGIYKTSLPETCLLNHENNSMGWVAPEDPDAKPDHYSKFLKAHAKRLKEEHKCLDISALRDPDGYTPRFVYGQYLKEQFSQIERLAQSGGIPFFKYNSEVKKIQILGKKATIKWTKNNQLHTLNGVDKILVTIGHSWKNILLKDNIDPKKFFQVYPIEPLMDKNTIAGKRVAVIGTGLSGVDATFTAIKSGAEQVILTSRSARLRAVRGSVAKYNRKFFTREAVNKIVEERGKITLSEVDNLFRREYKAAFETYRAYQQNPEQFKDDAWSSYIGQKFYVPNEHPDLNNLIFPEDTVKRLRDDVREVESCPPNKGLLWRSIVKSMYEVEEGLEFFDYVYQRLPVEDQVTFMRKIHRLHLNFTAAMPLPSAKRLLALCEQGKLVVMKGFKRIDRDSYSGLLRVEMNDGTSAYADIGVDATGYAKDMNNHPLYSHLIAEGQAVAHPAGGISIDPNTHALLTDDGLSPVLMAIGPATIGSTYVLKPDSIGNSNSALCIAQQVYNALSSESPRRFD